MSLFASSFEAGLPSGASITPLAGPSKERNASKKDKKRKRPSEPVSPARDDGKLRAMQKNLERVISGGVAIKSAIKEGREEMGSNGKKQKKRQSEQHLRALPKHKESPSRPAPSKVQREESSKKELQHVPKKALSETESRFSGSKPSPAELPMPHSIQPDSHDGEEGLTKLQKGMKAKLDGARFRWINEQLYSTPSTEALAMMRKDPKIFTDYHLTHRALTAAWPSPPLPHIIDRLRPLPKGTAIVDLGCGEAGLAKALVPEGKVVLSYDLVGDSDTPGRGKAGGWVVESDFLEGVPLPGRPGGAGVAATEAGDSKKKKGKAVANASEVVDVVVCCLSLMGVNWVGGIYEASRILKQSGKLQIAEVTSRFVSTEAFVKKIESFGFTLDTQESPSTHFTLFAFTKVADVPQGPARGEAGWQERVREGEDILRGCVYKKR